MKKLMLFVASVAIGFSAHAQTWPTKPLHIIVPSAAGSAPDIVTRILASELEKRLGQPVIAEDKPGAGGALGSGMVAKAAPDGYTYVMGNIGSHAMNVGVYPKLPYDPVKDFAPVSLVAVTPSLMTVSSALPIHSVKELLAYARKNGPQVTFASGGNGSSSHLAGAYLNQLADLQMRHVPYKSVQQALGDVAAQRVTLMISNLPPAMGLVQAGKLRPLAVTTPTRSAALPDVPTMAEAGVPGFDQTVWFALFAPAGTPPDIVTRLNQTIGAILHDPQVVERFAKAGATAKPDTPQELHDFVSAEVAKWTRVARNAHAVIQ